VYPVVTESAAVIVGKCDLLGEILGVQSRNQPQAGEGLETVADAHHQFSAFNKFLQLFAHPEFYPVGENSACSEVIAEREAANENKYVKLVKAAAAVKQIVEVYILRRGSADAEGCGSLSFAVQSESGNYKSLYFSGISIFHYLLFYTGR
jgi:hypothetical protein